MRRLIPFVTGMTFALALAGCSDPSDDPTDATAPETSAAATAAPTDDARATSAPSTSASARSEQSSTKNGDLPAEADAYLDAFLLAWAKEDEDRVSAMSTPEVLAGTRTWEIPAKGWRASYQNPDLEDPGDDTVYLAREHPNGAYLEAYLSSDALGGEGAVLNLTLTNPPLKDRRTGNQVNAYADAFYLGIVTRDLDSLRARGTKHAVAAARKYDSRIHGDRIIDHGFTTGRTGHLTLLWSYPDRVGGAEPLDGYLRTLELDLAIVDKDGRRGVVGVGHHVPG